MGKSKWISVPVALIGLAILAVLYVYNTRFESYEKYLVGNIGCLLWLPVVFILLFANQELSDYGFKPVSGINGYKLVIILFLLALPVYIIAARMPGFQAYYPIQKQAAYDLGYFGYYELSYGMYLFCWEFFFRGFLLFGLARSIGWWSVFVQAAAFGIMHIGKPGPEIAASFAAGILLGFIAFRSKSFIPCFVLHWASALTFDILVIMAKKGLLF
ncbi:MAG: CPBP family glutamic-type intramembrane protease [Armatimonadota bacterium]